MNRVRRVSRMYAERYGRPDHFARQAARTKRAQKEQQKIFNQRQAMHQVAAKNSGKAFHEPRIKSQMDLYKRPGLLKRLFRRQGR